MTIRGEGTYDFRHRTGQVTVRLPEDAKGTAERRPITELLAPGALYMKNRGAGVPADKWVRVETASLVDGNLVTGGVTDPYAAAELLRRAQDVTYVGEEQLAGVTVRHYRGERRAAGVGGERVLQGRGAVRRVPRRGGAAVQGCATCSVTSTAGWPVAVASTTLLYGFGAPATVRLPAARGHLRRGYEP